MENQKTKFNEERGITLVALIITVIILVILAAVAINAAHETGIIKFATSGVQNYSEAGVKENIIMNKTVDYLSSALSEIGSILKEGNSDQSAGEPNYDHIIDTENAPKIDVYSLADGTNEVSSLKKWPSVEGGKVNSILTSYDSELTAIGNSVIRKKYIPF